MRSGLRVTDWIEAWGFERSIPHDLATEAAVREVEPPGLKLALVSARSDHLTVQVMAGDPPLPDGWVYVKARGLFEIIRAERWPPLTAAGGERVLLTLRTYPTGA